MKYTTDVVEGHDLNEHVTLELPSELVRQARAAAVASNRRVEEIMAEWIERGIVEPPIESLSTPELLAACDSQLPDAIQDELSELLARNRETPLVAEARGRLDELLASYRRGLVAKARATKEAVTRGLKPRLGEQAA